VYPHPESDQHQNVTTFRGSSLSNAYQVWSTSINAFMSYRADTHTDTHTGDHNICCASIVYSIQRRSGKSTARFAVPGMVALFVYSR